MAAASLFEELRPKAFAVAYRMLGSVVEAEDVVQEAFLRFTRSCRRGERIESPPAYVSIVVARLCIDQLRAARVRRESYVGEWLPEPLVTNADEELPHGATAEDLDRIIESSRERGLLDADTSRLLDHGLDFRTRTAGEVMVPRVDVVTLAGTTMAVRVVELLDTGHTRFPVVGASIDDVLGIVSIAEVRDLNPARRHTTQVRELAVAAVMLPTTLALPQVLERLRAERRQMACVVDEYGGFAGILTLEDIAEELVGDIRDEDDLAEPSAVRDADGSWLLPGRWRLDEVADTTGVRLPDSDDYETVSGLVLAALGRWPTSAIR